MVDTDDLEFSKEKAEELLREREQYLENNDLTVINSEYIKGQLNVLRWVISQNND